MALSIYNTLSRTKEPFKTIEKDKVRMYVCGPTVYDDAHVGHAMSAMVFDIIRRYLEYKGFEVNHIMNFTDVDDKIINRANKMDVDPFQLAEGYIDEFKQQLDDLNIKPATENPRATREIDNIIKMIQGLIKNGFAYPLDGDVYFRIKKNKDYGKLSGRKIEDMQAGARIGVDKRKKHPMDFALWKKAKEGEPAWSSPWGDGRPGWHIECSAMSLTHLGEQIDIHGGGNDLIFPHHENEIAQSECYTGKQFSTYWVHNGMLQLSGEKMSKSIGNLVTIKKFLSEHSGDVLRMMVLNSGYRSPLTFNDEVIKQAEKALERIKLALKPVKTTAQIPSAKQDTTSEKAQKELESQINKTKQGFESSMDDDFNSAGALGHIFELVRVLNHARDLNVDPELLTQAQDLIKSLTGVLGLRLDDSSISNNEVEPFINLLIDLRLELKNIKQYDLADSIRDRLTGLGIILEDNKNGTSWRSK